METNKLYVSDKFFRGYFVSPSGLLEIMTNDEAQSAENIAQRLTTTLWSNGNISFGETLVSFTEMASRLEQTIRRMILEIFGVEKYLDELIGSTNYHVKLMKNKGSQPSTSTPNMVTLLYQNEVDGLEIQKKSDGEWINMQPSPDSFVVMIGESLCVWLNGGFSATHHRAMVKGNKARYSVGIYATPRGGYRVKAPEELVDDKNPMLFKPFDYEEFLGFYFDQFIPGSTEPDLKGYCGV